MRQLLTLIRQSRFMLLLALLASISGGLANAGLVALINQALSASPSQLTELGWRFLGLGALVLLARTLGQTFFVRLGQQAKATLRLQIIDRITNTSYPQLERHGAARAMAVLTQDLDTVVMFFVSLPNLAMYGAVIVGCLIYLGYLSAVALLFAVATIVIGGAGFNLANGRALFHLRASRQREDALVKDFRALFDGSRELKLHRQRRHAFVTGQIAPNIEAVRRQRTRGYVLYAAAASWGSLVFLAFIGCVLFVLSRIYPVAPQVMSGYAIVFLYMTMPIEGLLSAIPNLSAARVAFERINQTNLDLPPEPGLDHPVAGEGFRQITLSDVTYRYQRDDGVFTLGPINLNFTPGEVVFLTGGNGSGKTTLARLLVGLYAPETGTIIQDGQPVTDLTRDAYRQQFATVFSDFFLFEQLLGLDTLDSVAQTLLLQLQLAHKVQVEQGVFSTTALSQGQRKRLALLVAWLEDRPFYLFDEWAADQDPEFRHVFYHQLLPELKARGKTVLVISHDDRYFHLADRLLKLADGQLVSGA